MSDHCLFCQIVAGAIPSDILYEDDHVMAFRDIAPQAPVHVLVIPKRHVSSLDLLTPDDRDLMGIVMERAAHVARQLQINEAGYRTIINTNQNGGQIVFHLHVHLLGGKSLGAMVAH